MSISPKALQALKYIMDAGGKATLTSMLEDIGPVGKGIPAELIPKYADVNQRSGTLYLTTEGREQFDIHPKTPKRTAEDHMIWCKERALDEVKKGALSAAWASMASNLRKHPETAEQPRDVMIMGMTVSSHGADAVRRWREGFQVGKPHIDVDKVDAIVNREFAGRAPARAPSRFEGNLAAEPVPRDVTPYSRGAEINLHIRDLTVPAFWERKYRIPQFERFDGLLVEAALSSGPLGALFPGKSPGLIQKRREERNQHIRTAAQLLADTIIKVIEEAEGWEAERERYLNWRADPRNANTIDLNREKEPKA